MLIHYSSLFDFSQATQTIHPSCEELEGLIVADLTGFAYLTGADEDAKDCVVLGCAKVLTDPSGMRHLLTV